MTKSQKHQAEAIAILLAAGFQPHGETASQTVRIPTVRAPVYGGIGGELATFGGRPRFVKPGTTLRVTVGKVTTCFYDVVDGQTKYLVNLPTRDAKRIRFFAEGNLATGAPVDATENNR